MQGSGSPGHLVGQGRLGHFRFLQVSTLSSVVSFLTELRGKLLSSYLEEKLSAFLLLVKSRKKKKPEPSKYHSSVPTDQADHRL